MKDVHPVLRIKPHEWMMYFMLLRSGYQTHAAILAARMMGMPVVFMIVDTESEDEDGS